MKTRKLRLSIEKALTILTAILVVMAASVKDFNFIGAIIWIGVITLIGINCLIIKKYGRGWFINKIK